MGLRLARHFKGKFEVHPTTRSAEKYEGLKKEGFRPTRIEFPGDQVQGSLMKWSLLEKMDVLIITVNFSKKTEIPVLDARFENVHRFLNGFKKQIFLMSSIGVYPQMAGEITEDTTSVEELQPNIWSVEQQMRRYFPQINVLRLGGLMGDDRYLSKYKIADTTQMANHVHYEDIARVIEHMISLQSSGMIYNVVAPEHPTKQAILDQQLGNTKTKEIAAPSVRIVSSKKLMTELEYTFKHPDPRFFR